MATLCYSAIHGAGGQALQSQDRGHVFLFKYDTDDETVLHIYARHLTQPSEAIECFFAGKTTRNHERNRYETTTETHCLYWFWMNEAERVVYVITCFTR